MKVFIILPLREILKYKNENILYRFMELFNVSQEIANDLFKDCLIWLWLCANAAKDRKNGNIVPEKMAIDNSILIIDEMWHNFICFTKDYQEFCLNYLGTFIHHTPTPKPLNDELKRKFIEDISFLKERRSLQYEYMCNKLEIELSTIEATQIYSKWYLEYPKKYTKSKIKSLRKK